MHINTFWSIDPDLQFYAVQLLARWGVPFFFVTSAFFLFLKGENGEITKSELLNYVKRIAFLYLAWFIFNLPAVVYSNLLANGITSYVTWLTFFKELLFSSTFMGSWYLTSSIFGACFVYLLCKKVSTKVAVLITSVLYLVCILTAAYGNIIPSGITAFIDKFFVSPCISIICSPFFFAIGKYIAENLHKAESLRMSNCVMGAVVFGILYYVEITLARYFGLLNSTDASFFVVPWAIFMVLCCIRSRCEIKYARYMRKISTVVYCSQGLIILATNFVCSSILGITFSLAKFVIAAVMISACTVAVLLLQRYTKFKWTTYLT